MFIFANIMKKLIAIILALLSVAWTAQASVRLNMRDGLSESRTRGVLPLDDGRVAIATTATIDIFDGNQFRALELPPQRAMTLDGYDGGRRMACDRAGRLWLKNDRRQLFVADLERGEFLDPDSLLRAIGFTKKVANVYVAGSHVFVADTDMNLLHSSGNESEHVISLQEIPDRLIVYRQSLLLCYRSGRTEILDSNGRRTELSSGHDDTKGAVAAVGGDSLYVVYDSPQGTVADTYNLITRTKADTRRLPMPVTGLAVSLDSMIAIGPEGIVITKDGQLPRLLATEPMTGVTIDRNGDIWYATEGNGIVFDGPKRQRLFSVTDMPFAFRPAPVYVSEQARRVAQKVSDGITNCSLTDTTGIVWLGTRKGLLVVDELGKVRVRIDRCHGLSSANVQSVCRDSKGRIWIATARGISRITRLSADTFRIVNYGPLDGIVLDGREFRQGRLHQDSAGIMHAGFAVGTCLFNPDSVDVGQYAYLAVPEVNQGHGRVLLTVALAFVAVASVVVVCLLKKCRRKRDSVRNVLPPDLSSADGIIATLSVDNKSAEFLARLSRAVNDNIAREDLSVTTLSKVMAMDRTVLYRRMVALTGQTPSAYIKTVRMNLAKRLLAETGLSIADIAQKAGFSSPKYFSRVFRDSFGLTPAEFRKTTGES